MTVAKFKTLPLRIISAQTILYLALFFSPNNKIFFSATALFALYLFWLLKDWKQAAWLTLIATLPFERGIRSFLVTIPTPHYFLPAWKGATFLHLPITVKLLISTLLLLTIPFARRKKPNVVHLEDILLITFLTLGLFSLATSSYPNLAFISLIRLFFAATLFFLAKFFLANKKILALSMIVFFTLVTFEGIIALAQLILERPLGIFIEDSLLSSPFSNFSVENVFLFRSSASFTDPNTFAVFLVTLLPIIASNVFFKYPAIKQRLITSTALLLGLLGIISTFSRSAWIILALTIAILAMFSIRRKNFSVGKHKPLLILLIGTMLIFLFTITQRLVSLPNALLSNDSSGLTRLKLIKESLVIIKQNPLLGVGPGNFLAHMATNDVTGIARYFFFPVHNLYLLIAAETGIPSLIVFIAFIASIIRKATKSQISTNIFQRLKIGTLGGIFAFLISMLVYTNEWVTLELLFILCASVNTEKI